MPTLYHAPGLAAFQLTFADGSTRTVLASSLQSAVDGIWPSSITNVVAGSTFDPTVPPPTLASLVPPSAKIGDASFTLRVLGTGFTPNAVIVFAGQNENTVFVSPTEVTTLVNMAYWHGPDPEIEVTVHGLSGVESNTLLFAMQPAAELAAAEADA